MDWKTIYHKNYRLVLAFVTSLGANRHIAEEIVQETFLSFMSNGKDLEDPILPKLIRRASDRWTNYIKKASEEQKLFRDKIIVESSKKYDMIGPSHLLIEKENQQEISMKLNSLPVDDVALLVLVYQKGYSIQGAADMLGIPRRTASRILKKAAERLLDIIRSEEECRC